MELRLEVLFTFFLRFAGRVGEDCSAAAAVGTGLGLGSRTRRVRCDDRFDVGGIVSLIAL